MIDMDQVEDFYEALSAAIESGLDTPGAHAVSDMYRAAIARAGAAEAELKSTRDFYDLAIGVAQAHEARIDELKAQLAALKAVGGGNE